MEKKLKNKTRLGSVSLRNDLIEEMNTLSEKTNIPKTKLYEMAVEDFVMKCTKSITYPISREKIHTGKFSDAPYKIEKNS